MTIPLFYLKRIGGSLICYCNYDVKFLELNNIPVFYIDVLKAWADVQELISEAHDENRIEDILLWNNKHITIDVGKSIYWKGWHGAGILRIKDLLDENNITFLTLNKFVWRSGLKVPFSKLYGLISAIPHKWKQAFNMDSLDAKQKAIVQANKRTCKRARHIFSKKI